MARPKMDRYEKSLRICMQTELYRAINASSNAKHVRIEIDLKLKNSKQDGAVWRKVGRGVHLVSRDKLDEMISSADELGWCDSQEIYASVQNILETRDAGIIEDRMDDWIAQIEDMAILCRFGTLDNQNKIVKALEDAIKVLQS